MSVANGALVNGQVVVNANTADGYTRIYDAAGHVIGSESWGADLFVHQAGVVLTQSIVDARGQTTATLAPHLLSDAAAQLATSQKFDDDGRVVETRSYFAPGTIYTWVDSEGTRMGANVSGMLQSAQQYGYDADGRITSQTQLERPTATTTRTDSTGTPVTFPSWVDGMGKGSDTTGQYDDLTVLDVSSVVSYTGTNLGYDAAGRLKGYTYNVAGGSTQTFLSSYLGRDSWLESAVDATSTNTNERPTSSTIAYDAAGREISIRERTVYATIDDRWRFFANDGEGHILRRRDGTEPQAGGAFTQGTTTLDQQTSNHHMVYADGQQVAALDEAGTIDALSHVTGFANTNIGSTNVVVQDGETLQSIAQRIYGNSGLWYVLAAANALDANTALVAGTTLKAPEVTTNKNDASTFKPYNPSDITGPTSPGLPYIHAPPGNGCGTLGMIVMIVIAIVVTYFSFGTLAPEMSVWISGAAAAAAAGGVTVAGAIAAGFVAGAVGSIASQAAGSAMGVAHFSWRQVAVDATVNAITEGFGAWGATTDAFGQAVKDGAEGARELSTLGRVASAVVGYGAMVGASVAVGRDPNFSWKAVAATAVGSFLSAELGGKVPTLQGGSPFGKFVNNFEGYVVNGTVNAATRSAFGVDTFNWGQIAADAFGNALGSAAIKAISSVQQQQAKASTPFGGGQPYFGPSMFGNGSGSDPFSTQAFGASAAPTSAFDGANPFGGIVNPSLGLFDGFGDSGSVGASASQAGPKTISYIVQPGDTPDTIAEKQLGSRYLFGEVMAAAGITDPRKLQVGATLELTDPASMDQAKLALSMQDAAKYYGYTEQSQSFARLSQAYTQQADTYTAEAAQDRQIAAHYESVANSQNGPIVLQLQSGNTTYGLRFQDFANWTFSRTTTYSASDQNSGAISVDRPTSWVSDGRLQGEIALSGALTDIARETGQIGLKLSWSIPAGYAQYFTNTGGDIPSFISKPALIGAEFKIGAQAAEGADVAFNFSKYASGLKVAGVTLAVAGVVAEGAFETNWSDGLDIGHLAAGAAIAGTALFLANPAGLAIGVGWTAADLLVQHYEYDNETGWRALGNSIKDSSESIIKGYFEKVYSWTHPDF